MPSSLWNLETKDMSQVILMSSVGVPSFRYGPCRRKVGQSFGPE